MPIVVGHAKKAKSVGEVAIGECPHCGGQGVFHLIRRRRYFRLFWRNVIPISRAEYLLACDVCGAGYPLEADDVAPAKEMLETTAAFKRGELDQEEYQEEATEFFEALSFGFTKDVSQEQERIPGIE